MSIAILFKMALLATFSANNGKRLKCSLHLFKTKIRAIIPFLQYWVDRYHFSIRTWPCTTYATEPVNVTVYGYLLVLYLMMNFIPLLIRRWCTSLYMAVPQCTQFNACRGLRIYFTAVCYSSQAIKEHRMFWSQII